MAKGSKVRIAIIIVAALAYLSPAMAADTGSNNGSGNNPGASTAQKQDIWSGNWFSCEFAKSQSPPYDDCAMFDDEGFRFENGRFTYIRITQSDETACKGEKRGQCFRRDRPAIEITSKDRGKLDLGEDTIKVRYFGCTQLFHFADHEYYREIEPDEKRCWWARERHFYIARYDGAVTVKK
jgi:hypothetical protein